MGKVSLIVETVLLTSIIFKAKFVLSKLLLACKALCVVIVLIGAQVQAKEPVILVVGDSISAAFGLPVQEGWVALMRKELQQSDPQTQVINASISGDTTQGGLARLPELLTTYQPTVTVIELGGNDGLRGTPIKIIKQNLKNMVQLSQRSNSKVLLLGMQIPPNYGAKYTELFKNMYAELAAELNIALVPFLLAGVAENSQLMQGDGIHPQAAAQPMMYQLVRPALMPLL